MRAHAELIRRCALDRIETIGSLSKEGFAELELAVERDVDSFVETPQTRAFQLVAEALPKAQPTKDDELLDDEAYVQERERRRARLRKACDSALVLDARCLDAQLLEAIMAEDDPEALFERLLSLWQRESGECPTPESDTSDAWPDVLSRPLLRLGAALSRAELETARYRASAKTASLVMLRTPHDELGCRHTCALAYARLEDEDAFGQLDASNDRHGDAWTHVARALLLYKLDRMPAARRALLGFARLCEGGSYALLRPTYVETYLPDRPEARQGSFEEAQLALHEADPIVVDTPDFVAWAADQEGIVDGAVSFAEHEGLDW